VGSVAEPERTKRCPSCGDEFGDPGRDPEGPGHDPQVVPVGAKIEILGDDVFLCVRCIGGARSGADWGYRLPTKEDSPLPLPGGFDELFKAAKVLLEDNAGENQIIPTLALANHLCHGVPRLVREKESLVDLWGDEQAWDQEADSFTRRFGGLRPVRATQGVLVLERLPVFVGIDYAVVAKTPEAVAISVYPHRRLAEAEEVASEYDKALSDAGILCNEQRAGNLSFDFHNRSLVIRVWPGTVVERTTVTEGFTVPRPGWRRDAGAFPEPQIVQGFYNMLRHRFARDLATRTTGPVTEADNLVPACVAFFLRSYGLKGRKEPQKLLNAHVLPNTWKKLPEEGYGSSATKQLWADVNNDGKVGGPLMDAMWTLFYEGHE
jgi:hypothetical protein